MFCIENNEKNKSTVITGASSEKQKESSLILRKAKFQAIFKFVLPLASKGTEGIKYNRISAFVSMLVLLIRRSLEKFFPKNFRDDRFCFGFAKVLALAFLLSLNLSESWAVTCKFKPDNGGKYSLEVKGDSGGNVFSGCDNGFPTGISGWSQAKSKITSATLENITSIGSGAFAGASSLTSITIPDSVESIGNGAFYNATGLTSITIPEGVTSIGESAFHGASSLTSITIPNSVTSIGGGAFDGATGLTSITIPEGVTSIGFGAFYGASSLTSITIPEGVTIIGTATFASTGLTSITIPDSVTEIGDAAFFGASSLTSITIPDSVTYIGDSAFSGASSLTEINCAGTESDCAALRTLLDTKGYLSGRTFKRVEPVTKCSSYTSSGCDACYAGYAYGNSSCHACGTGKNCHWDDTAEKVVFDGCKDKYLRKENKCVASSQGCGANFRLNDGECDRLRYTPAEAAKVLRDDNNNSVTITFKK